MKFILSLIISGIYLAMLGVYLNAWISPQQWYLISFIGLGYSFLMVGFILSLILAYFVSRKLFTAGIIVFFIGIRMHLNVFSIAVPNDPISEDRSFKILSYNVRLFDLYTNNDGSTKRQIFDYLKQEDADIYCFQEFYQQDPPTKFVTRDSLMPLLGMKNVHEHYSFRYQKRQYFGVAMMTRFPVVSRGDVSFEDAEHDDHNYCIYMDVVPSVGDTIRVYNVHLQSVKLNSGDIEAIDNMTQTQPDNNLKVAIQKLHVAFEKRQAQVDKIVQHMEESPYNIVIAGDFNDTPMSYAYLKLRKYLKDSFTSNRVGMGATYAGKLPVGRIDYILHSKELHPFNFQIQKDALSDHYAISTQFNY